MDLNLLQVLILSEVVVTQLNVRVDAHSATPDIDLVCVGQSHAVVVAKADILHESGSP